MPEGAFGVSADDITIVVTPVPDSLIRATTAATEATVATATTTEGKLSLITPTVDFTIEQDGMQ